MEVGKALAVSRGKVGTWGAKSWGGAKRSVVAFVDMLRGKPDLAAEPKSSAKLEKEARVRNCGGALAISAGAALILWLGSPEGRALVDAARSVSEVGAVLGWLGIWGVITSGFAVMVCGMDSNQSLGEDLVEWLRAERQNPGFVREYCAKAALLERGLTKGECEALMALASERRMTAQWKRMDGLAILHALDAKEERTDVGWARRVVWVMKGGNGSKLSLSSSEMSEAQAYAIAIWLGLFCSGTALLGVADTGLAGGAALVGGSLLMLVGFVGVVASAVVNSAIKESSLEALVDAAQVDPDLAKSLVVIGLKGREISQVEADHLMYELAEKRRRARDAELMSLVLDDALAASLAEPSIERVARGNEGSRMMLSGLTGRGMKEDSVD